MLFTVLKPYFLSTALATLMYFLAVGILLAAEVFKLTSRASATGVIVKLTFLYLFVLAALLCACLVTLAILAALTGGDINAP